MTRLTPKRVARRVVRGLSPRPRPEPEPRIDHPVCDDLASWASSWPGATREVVDPPFTTTRPLPKTTESTVDPSFVPLCEYPVAERAVVKLPGARLRGQIGVVFLPDGQVVGELAALTPAGRRAMLGPEPDYHRPLPARAVEKAGNFCAVLGFGVGHYYHWSHDLVIGMRRTEQALPPDTQLIVPETLKPFQRATLDLLDLDGHPRVNFPKGEVWEFENLYVVTPRLKTQIDSSEPYRWFRERAMARYGIVEVEPTRRLYLSRRHDGHWRTVNEPEVEEVLAELGFETVEPATMSFREQIELFGQADAIVGTGAGLFNMVFSPPGTKILQFQEPNRIVHALWAQAAAMGFDYHYVLCDPVPNGRRNADIRVPLDKLRTSLAALDLPGRPGR